MTQENTTVRLNSKSVPSAGMRGGLGRTLLTAFLLLSIVPLSVISFVAATQARRNLETELREKLATVAALTESQLRNWVTSQQLVLTTLSDRLAAQSQGDSLTSATTHPNPTPSSSRSTLCPSPGEDESAQTLSFSRTFYQIAESQAQNPAVLALLLADQHGRIMASQPPSAKDHAFVGSYQHQSVLLEDASPLIQAIAAGSGQPMPLALMLSEPVAENDLTLIALMDPRSLIQPADAASLWSKNGEVHLVSPSGQALQLYHTVSGNGAADLIDRSSQAIKPYSAGIEAALSGQSGVASYQNHQGTTVIGAYRWLPELGMALLVEQPQESALASSDELAVVLIGATLAVVLLTALIAAAVTRRITLPVVQLTATAVQIAAGDLDQKVPATRRDEIGILARAFNVMTTKLRILYEDLEQKVRERTQQLQEASAEVRYRAMQLAVSAEVGRVVTSILDRDPLLAKVVELIRDCFQAYFVAVYFVDDSGRWAVLQEGSGGLGEELKADQHRVDLSQDDLVSQAIKSLKPRVYAGPPMDSRSHRDLFPHTHAELAVPLRIGQRVIGVLDVHSTHEDAFNEDEISVLETLSGQVAVAIENARVYELERQAAQQLRELEELRRRFLSNMSRELRMPLNNIIGFSRVMLKGIDGPITETQREDLNAIYESGHQLLALINDILDIAQIEAGAMELAVRPVDFGEIAQSVIPTANALLQGRPIRFHYEIDANLPVVLADPHRLRQVLVKLLSNAAKFTNKGEITLRVWHDTTQIIASVIDTGIGIPDRDRDKIFEMFRQLSQPVQSDARGTGLGLAFSKEIVEMHGGTIWFESKEGRGTAFTISLPILEAADDSQ